MKSCVIGGTLAALASSMVPASAQDIVGSWKQTTFYQKVVATGEKRILWGSEKVTGRVIYTKEGTFCSMGTGTDRKQAGGVATDEERLALFKTMYAYCGTYKVEGDKLRLQADVAWTPAWLKVQHDPTIKTDGKTLNLTTTPFKSQLDGVEVIAITEYTKE